MINERSLTKNKSILTKIKVSFAGRNLYFSKIIISFVESIIFQSVWKRVSYHSHENLAISYNYDHMIIWSKMFYLFKKKRYYNRTESFIHLKESVRGDIHIHVARLIVNLTLIVSNPTVPPSSSAVTIWFILVSLSNFCQNCYIQLP